jgi:hypothetical protein
MGLKRKCCGLLIIYLVLILSIGLSPVSATGTNGTENGDYVMADSNIIASITTDAPNGWWSMLPYWDFKTEYYGKDSGRKAPTSKDAIDCGALYGHDTATNDLDKIYDSMNGNAESIIVICDAYAARHNETCYDSGSPTKWNHVPRAALLQIYQNNFLTFKAAQKALIAYYNSLTPFLAFVGAAGAIGAVSSGYNLLKVIIPKIKDLIAKSATANVADTVVEETMTAPACLPLRIGAGIARGVVNTVSFIASNFGTLVGLSGGSIIGSILLDVGLHNSKLAKIESKLGSWEAEGLAVEAQTFLNTPSINKIDNWTAAIEKDLNISGNDTVDRGYVLDYYRLLGYDVINYTNTKTLYDQMNSTVETKEEPVPVPGIVNNSSTQNITPDNNSTIKPLSTPLITGVNNSTNKTVPEPVLTKKTNNLMDEFARTHKADIPNKVVPEVGSADFIKDLSMDNFNILPPWDPWVTPDMAPHMKSHYKWYQFCQAIYDAIKIVCFWISFVIIMIAYTLYWIIDLVFISPFITLFGLIGFIKDYNEMKDYTDSVNNQIIGNDTNDSVDTNVNTGGYDVHINYVQVKVPVGNNSTAT